MFRKSAVEVWLLVVLMILVFVPAALAGEALPRYADYPVKEHFTGKPAPPDMKSDPDAKQFASRLKEGAAKGPNFAGHFTVISWGCGTECEFFMIVDAKNGSIYSPSFGSQYGLCYRMDSSLLIVDPITDFVESGRVPSGQKTKYYTWDGKELNLVTENRWMVEEEKNCK